MTIEIDGELLAKVDRSAPLYRTLVSANAKLKTKDPFIWGESAAPEAAVRLNWVDLPTTSLDLIPELEKIEAKFGKSNQLILCGMGGSSLAPEVLAATYEKKIFILDSTDPNYLSHALNNDLKKTIVLVSSKSGSTIETSSQRSFFENQFMAAGLDPKEHMIFCTDPNSPLDVDARKNGFQVVNADPNVGGRFSALSAFGLVPAAILGIEIDELLNGARQTLGQLFEEFNSAIDLAYLIATQCEQYLAFTDSNTMPGLSDWIEQLIAESTGKEGTGRLPVVIESSDATIGSSQIRIGFENSGDLQIRGDLGSQFIFWEWTTALLGAALKIDPFNQPNVTEAKEQTGKLLAEWNGVIPNFKPKAIDGEIEIFGDKDFALDELRQIIDSIPTTGYLAITAYLDRIEDLDIFKLREILAKKSGRPVTFGWGPRFLHSTGQFHKGGQPNGSFLQLTGEVENDFEIPKQKYGFKALLMAQALGDARALKERNYPVSRLHFRNRKIAIAQLIEVANKL
ncbi:MAG: hypothetical protein RL301_534 [Actinomycetota bacterium]|jgi:glucose-6-phosphate isomerase